jgi:hypothetical protein
MTEERLRELKFFAEKDLFSRADKMLSAIGQVHPLAIVFGSYPEPKRIVIPLRFDTQEMKSLYMKAVHAAAMNTAAECVFLIAEAWSSGLQDATRTEELLEQYGEVSKFPESLRKEEVMLLLNLPNGHTYMLSGRIYRDAAVPYTKEVEWHDLGQAEGRMIGRWGQ